MKKYSSYLAATTLIAGIITIVVTFFIDPLTDRDSEQRVKFETLRKQKDLIDALKLSTDSLRIMSRRNEDIIKSQYEIAIQKAIKGEISSSKLKLYIDYEIGKLRDTLMKIDNNAGIKSLNERITNLENALMQSPSKALAVPLLQHEIQNLKELEAKDILDTKASIATIYDQNKWFIGLMFTLAIGMISLAITNLLPQRSKPIKPGNVDPAQS